MSGITCKIVSLILFLEVISFSVFSQTISDIKKDSKVYADETGAVYIVRGTEVKKYSSEGEFLFRFSDNIYGNISYLDVSDPLRILLFYKESNVVIFLDCQLSILSSPIELYSTTGCEALASSVSARGGFWIYCNDFSNLQFYNSQIIKTRETQNLRGFIHQDTVLFIQENNDKVFLVLNSRILVFDIYGTYLTTYFLHEAKSINIGNAGITFIRDSVLYLFAPQQHSEYSIDTLPANCRSAFVINERVYAVQGNTLKVVDISDNKKF